MYFEFVELSITYLILLFILVILFPLNGILTAKRIKKFLNDYPGAKTSFFQQTIIIQIVLAALVIAVMAFNQDPIREIGLSFLARPLYLIGLLTACLIGFWIVYKRQFDPQKLQREIEKDAAVKFLLPTTNQEYQWSIGASFAAGICEEIVFRGFLYWQLALLIPVIPAIFLTNLVFGLGHYATGLKNASIAFGLGILFSLVFLSTNSLWIPMLLHVLTDIYSMTKGKRYFEQNWEEG